MGRGRLCGGSTELGGDIGEDGFDRAVAIDGAEEAAFLVVADYGLGLGAVLGKAIREGIDAVIGAAAQGGAATGAGVGGERDMEAGAEGGAAPGADEAMGHAVADNRLIGEDEEGEIDLCALLSEGLVEGLGLGNAAREAIEDPGAIVGGEPLADDLDADLIGDEEAALEVLRGAETRGGAEGFLLAKHGAYGWGLEAEALLEQLCLGPLPGGGRA